MVARTKPPEWPADRVERRPVASLVPYARNARTHSEAQVAQIAASVREWGWTVPVLVDEQGGIIAGHGRVLAARKLGIDEVPVMVASGWSEAQKRAYVVADNKLVLNGEWDFDALKHEIGGLEELGFDLELTGFGRPELDSFLAPDTDPAGEWRGMPEFAQADKAAFQTIAVHLPDQAAVEAFAELIGQPISPKTRFVWYPQAEIERYADKRYAAAE